MLSLLYMLIGLAILIAGAEGLVRGASALAQRLGVPPVVVGLTVVAFGTSTPELAVNVAAALEGNTGLSFGNVVGSNIANIGLILAAAALFRPLSVHVSIINREIPMLLLGTAAAIAMTFDIRLGSGVADEFSRGDGIVLLLLFCVFLYYTLLSALRQRGDAYVQDVKEDLASARPMGVGVAIGLTIAGLVGVIFGGDLSVDNAVSLARGFGISDALIGLTLLAVGTGLPELVTSIVAARRGASDLAIGNVVGSNIYNLLFVQGATAVIRPIAVPSGGHVDLLVMAALTLVLLPLSLFREHKIGRRGGALLLAGYIAYIVWRTAMAA